MFVMIKEYVASGAMHFKKQNLSRQEIYCKCPFIFQYVYLAHFFADDFLEKGNIVFFTSFEIGGKTQTGMGWREVGPDILFFLAIRQSDYQLIFILAKAFINTHVLGQPLKFGAKEFKEVII